MDATILDDIQTQVEIWLNYQYDGFGHENNCNDVFAHLAAIVEESGELIESVEDNDSAEVRDAIGDIMIGLIAYCSAEQWNIAELYYEIHNKQMEPTPKKLLIILSHLSRATLKGNVQYPMRQDEYKQKANKAVKNLLIWLNSAAKGDDLVDITWTAWQTVRERVYGPGYGSAESIKWP